MPTDHPPEFYLISGEGTEYEPRTCYVLERLSNSLRDDFALVEVKPAFTANTYYSLLKECFPQRQETSLVVLATRHNSESLFPVNGTNNGFPSKVYICLLKSGERPIGNVIGDNDIVHVDYGILFGSKEDAIHDQKESRKFNDMTQKPKFKGGQGSNPPSSW